MLAVIKHLKEVYYKHATIVKIIALVLLFSSSWGLWWFDTDLGAGRNYLFLFWLQHLLFKDVTVAVIYTFLLFIAIAGFVLVPFIRHPLRWPLMIVLLIGAAVELTILDLHGAPSSQNLFWLMWHERASAGEAATAYAAYILRNCAFVVILGILLCAKPTRRFSLPAVFGLVPILSQALVAGTIIHTKGGTQAFPAPFGTFANAAFVLAASQHGSPGPRVLDRALLGDAVASGEVKTDGAIHPVFKKIVFIMDESVRGDYLSLNDSTYNTTPFLRRIKQLINFGVATAAGNCSYLSRTIIRFGMRQSDLPGGWREALKKPTIWQFARRAGYKTVFIDAFEDQPKSHNAHWRSSELSPAEEPMIDSYIASARGPGYLRDQRVANELLEALRQEEPAFIYVNKYGVHIPYSTKHPPDFDVASVELKSSRHWQSRTTWSIDVRRFLRSLLPPYDDEIAHYPNAIAWTVDEFFKTLLPSLDLSETLILYTSDHGQSLLPSHFSHCTSAPPVPMGEVYVPLLAITSEAKFFSKLERGASLGLGNFSHFEIFPTLLLALGYDVGWVQRAYGASLMDVPSSDRRFMIGSPAFQPLMISVESSFKPNSSVDGRLPGQSPQKGARDEHQRFLR